MFTRARCLPFLLMIALVALVAGCPPHAAAPLVGPSGTAPTPPAVTPASPTPPAAKALSGGPTAAAGGSPCGMAGVKEALPDLAFTSLKGEMLSLSFPLKGQVVLVDFWGMLCAGCVEGLDAYQKDPDFVGNPKLEIIAVARDTNKTALKQFAKEHGWKFPVVMMTPEIQKALLSTGGDDLPQVRIIDQQGRLRYKLGSTDATHEKVKCLVDGLIGK
jgi:peroxiredoxin